MNYLETGLPHTQFIRKKTEFSPPRFIPLCGLSRKYQGLEPLSRSEVDRLIQRLSEPKKTGYIDDTTLLSQLRPRSSPGSGRFVGQKKMSTLEIEEMVLRLCSRRSSNTTIAEAGEGDAGKAEDTENEALSNTNQTRRTNSSGDEDSTCSPYQLESNKSDSDLHRQCSSLNKSIFDRSNSHRSSADTDNGNYSPFDELTDSNYNTRYMNTKDIPVSSDVTSGVTDARRESCSKKMEPPARSWTARLTPRRCSSMNERQDTAKIRQHFRLKPSVSFSRGTYFSSRRDIKHESTKSPDESENERPEDETTVHRLTPPPPRSISVPPSYSIKRQPSVVEERKLDLSAMFAGICKSGRTVELTRPPPSTVELFPPAEKSEQISAAKLNTPNATKTVLLSPPQNAQTEPELNSLIKPEKPDTAISPRPKYPRLDEIRMNRYKPKPNDDLLIDQVATYNRTRKYRFK